MSLKLGLMYIPAYESGFAQPFAVWYAQMLEQIALADAAGLHGVWLAEHRIPGYAFAAPQLFLTAAALRTNRIRLGTAVCLVSLHHPVQTAEDFAALDVLSGGRLNFGAGRGQFPYDFAVAGVPLEESRERFDENLEAILRLWSEEGPVEHNGRFHQFTHRLLPRPLQRPHPPVFAAAARTPASYVWAGERGFHLQIAPLLFSDLDVLRGHLAAYRAAAASAGHDPAALDLLAAYPLYVGEREDDAVRAADPHLRRLAHYNAFALYAGMECGRPGAFDAYLHSREDGAPTEDGVPAAAGRDWDAWKRGRVIFGSPDQVVDQIGRVVEAHGATYLLFEVFYGGQTQRETLAYLERFASRVMPQLDLAPPPPAVPPPRTDDATGAAMSDAAPASLSSAGDE
jgi:alkanesulfonate monooxygenase SsuD/methylene tetrahydromethanopterin reductase-like flavin-dependent oxidoreductase (luciferase family)